MSESSKVYIVDGTQVIFKNFKNHRSRQARIELDILKKIGAATFIAYGDDMVMTAIHSSQEFTDKEMKDILEVFKGYAINPVIVREQ